VGRICKRSGSCRFLLYVTGDNSSVLRYEARQRLFPAKYTHANLQSASRCELAAICAQCGFGQLWSACDIVRLPKLTRIFVGSNLLPTEKSVVFSNDTMKSLVSTALATTLATTLPARGPEPKSQLKQRQASGTFRKSLVFSNVIFILFYFTF
jgi:hypothetical protein